MEDAWKCVAYDMYQCLKSKAIHGPDGCSAQVLLDYMNSLIECEGVSFDD